MSRTPFVLVVCVGSGGCVRAKVEGVEIGVGVVGMIRRCCEGGGGADGGADEEERS